MQNIILAGGYRRKATLAELNGALYNTRCGLVGFARRVHETSIPINIVDLSVPELADEIAGVPSKLFNVSRLDALEWRSPIALHEGLISA